MSNKWVYLFEEGNADMRNLLGGKGANLAEMTNLGQQKLVRNIITAERQFQRKFRDRFLMHFPSWRRNRIRNSEIRKIRSWFQYVPAQGHLCPV